MENIRYKVLFLASWYPSRLRAVNGIFIKKHAEAVSKYCDVAVLYVTSDPNMDKKTYDIEYADENGIPTVRVYYKRSDSKIPGVNFIRNIKGGYLGLKMIKGKFGRPDINHVNVAFPAGLLALFLKKLRKIPYIITEHSSTYTEYYAVFHKQPFRTKIFTKLIFKNANTVSAVSQYLLDELKRHNLTNKNGFVIPNAIDIPQSLHSSRNSNVVIKILTVSLLCDSQKNISGLINAIGNITKNKYIELHIVGDGEDRERLEEHTKKLGLLNKRVFFHGYVPNNELYKHFSYANFFVLNSNCETFSVVSAEALAHGIPVVVTKCGGPEEFINKEVGIFVERQNEESLVCGLEDMIENWRRYDSMKIHDYAKERFSYDVVGRQIYKIYASILTKWKAGLCGEKITIQPTWKVLDVGSGHNPNRRATVLLERELEGSIHRGGDKAKVPTDKSLVVGDATESPFGYKKFDYAIASHIAEHIEDVCKFICELQRVSKRGYIETPGPLSEFFLNEPYHLWVIYKRKGILIFKRKKIFQPFSNFFYGLFYLNENRYGHKTLFSRGLFAKTIKKTLNRVWKYLPYTYVKYRWEGNINYKILN